MEDLIINIEKYRCNICNCPTQFLLCEECFKKDNSIFEENINKFINTRELLSKKIEMLLIYNKEKSKKLNKKVILDKYKENLDIQLNKETSKVKILEEESKKIEELLKQQKQKNDLFSSVLKSFENDDKKDSNNLEKDGSEFESNNKLSELKKKIFEINSKITNFKKDHISKLFKELFIERKAVIKISEFFTDKQYYDNSKNFSIILSSETSKNLKNNFKEDLDNNNNDIIIGKEIKIDILKENDILLKRFILFFKTMISFLEKAYKKLKIEKMPFKMNKFKIEYKNGYEFNCEINKSKLNEPSSINNITKGFHLLNINYIFLMQNIFGDSTNLNDWFDISWFLTDQDKNIGSIEKILEEAKNGGGEEEFCGFVVIDE